MTPADLAESMVPVACDLACRVRDGDADGITRMAEAKGWDVETKALLVVLAAMVPDDGPVGDLLAWTDGLEAVMEWRQAQMLIPVPGRPVTEPCGTYAAARRHMRRKEPVDEACRVAYNERHRAESRASMARVRAQRAAAGEAGQDAA